MNFRKLVLIILVVMLAALMVACGGDDDDDAGSNDSTVNLPQEVSGPVEGGGTITAAYPENWVTGSLEDGALTVASSAAVMDKMDSGEEGPAKGEAAAAIMFLPTEMLGGLGLAADATPGDAVSLFINMMAGGSEDTTLDMSDPVTFESNGKSGGMIFGTVTEGDLELGVIMTAVPFDNGMGMVMFTCHPDDVDSNKSLAQAMAGKLVVTASE